MYVFTQLIMADYNCPFLIIILYTNDLYVRPGKDNDLKLSILVYPWTDINMFFMIFYMKYNLLHCMDVMLCKEYSIMNNQWWYEIGKVTTLLLMMTWCHTAQVDQLLQFVLNSIMSQPLYLIHSILSVTSNYWNDHHKDFFWPLVLFRCE